MKATIEIECKSIGEFMQNLQSLADYVDRKAAAWNLTYRDELPDGSAFADENFYGNHFCKIQSGKTADENLPDYEIHNAPEPPFKNTMQ